MELGVYSFGDTPRDADGTLGSTSDAIRNLFDAIVRADEVGLDYFGVGEHHTADMPASSPGALISAAAAATHSIRLGSAVSVLSTDDPIRVFQQFATADAISGGRVEITAGRGSSVESFPCSATTSPTTSACTRRRSGCSSPRTKRMPMAASPGAARCVRP